MAYTKPIARKSDIRRAFDEALRSPVRLRSVDFTDRDGRKLSFVIDNGTKTDTDPVTTITESELKELI